jgi:tripartite-type tricarboxylate transporter receptor subunit TctC
MRTSPISRRTVIAGLAGLGAGPLLPRIAAAQAWPSKAVRFVVPFAPGGSSEIIARATAAELSKQLGQSVYVDNKPGGAGNIAMAEVARADDQHTVILGHIGTLAVNPFIFDKLPYDPNADFKPVSLLAKVPSLYLVHPDLPAKNLKEFIALAKKKPGQLNYGSAGNGSAGHLAMEYLKMATDTFITHVPYRGTGPQLTDLIAGRLDAASVGASAVLQFVRTGKLRCIATGTAQRIPQLPDVPTVAEQGHPGFEMTQWYGLLAPATLPPAALEKLAVASARAVKEPATVERLSHDAAIPVGSTSAEFAKFIAEEQKRWKQVTARAKIKPDA